MADEDLSVKFGADIGEVKAGTQQVKAAIESIHGSAEHVGESFKTLAELAGIAFSIEGIKHFIEAMGELGLQTERVMAQLGISAEATLNLEGIAKLTGGSLQGMAMSIERMSLSIQKSTRDSFNPAAQGLKVLGLNAKDLIGLPADQYFEKLAGAVGKFNPSLNLTNALMSVGGKGVAQMLPALLLGSEGYKKFQEEIAHARDGIAAAIPGMAQTHEKLTLLGLSTQSFGAVLFEKLKPAIDGTIQALTGFVQWLRDAGKEGGSLSPILNILSFAAKSMATAFTLLLGTVRGLGEAIATVWKLSTSKVEDFETIAAASAKNLEKIGAETKKNLEDIWRTRIEVHPHGEKDDAAALNEMARQQIEIHKMALETQIADEGHYLDRLKIAYDTNVAVFGMTERDKIDRLMQATKMRLDVEAEGLTQIRDLWPAHSKEWESEEKKRVEASQKAETEMLRLSSDALKAQKKQWDDVLFNPLLSSWDGHLRGLLAGTEKFKDAMKSVLGDVLIEWIKMIEKKAIAWATGVALEVGFTESGEAAKTTAVAVGVAARASAEQAGLLSTLGTRIASVISAIAASAAEVFANLAAWFSSLGPWAIPAAAAGAAGVTATAMAMLPSRAVGDFRVPRDMAVNVHKDEMIVPAGGGFADALRGAMTGGGGSGHTFNVTVQGGATQADANLMIKALKQAIRMGDLRLPAGAMA